MPQRSTIRSMSPSGPRSAGLVDAARLGRPIATPLLVFFFFAWAPSLRAAVFFGSKHRVVIALRLRQLENRPKARTDFTQRTP